MTRAWALFLVLFLLLPGLSLLAQEPPSNEQPESPSPESPENPENPPIDSEWGKYNISVYNRGDKTFTITLGVLIPTLFNGVDEQGVGLSVGGTGTLAFSYFLTPHLFVGGELSGMFMSTRGKNMLYMIPFGARIGYQFIFRRFEFPFSFMIGGAPTLYLEQKYFGLIMKPGAGVFWRLNPDWSFGLNTSWWFLPQWPKTGPDAYGNFLELTLSARYHF